MIEIYPQIDLNNREKFLFWNQGQEDFSGTIIVFEGTFNFPIVRWEFVNIPAGMTYFYVHYQNVQEYVSMKEFSGYRYLFIREDGERKELDFTFKPKHPTIHGHDIYLFDDACGTYFETLCSHSKKEFFGKYPGWTLDLGASIGGYTAGALISGSSFILSIEPNPISFKSLRRTYADFNNIFPVWGAVSSSEETHIWGNFREGNSVGNRISKDGDVKVPNYTISQLVDFYKIDEIGLMKIDIEGEEYNVVPNLSDDILNKTHSIHLEAHVQYGGDDSYLSSYLISKGFFHILLDDRTESSSVREHLFYK